MKENAKSTRLGWKIWFSEIVFGLVGQIAWVVENMYFATFAQDIYTNSGNRDMAYVVTTLMVIFSAITATVTTIFAGGLCDKLGIVDEIRRFAFFEKHEFPHGVRVRSVGRCVLSAQKVFVEHNFFEFRSHFLTLNHFCFIIADFFCLVNDLEIKAKKSYKFPR